MVKLRGQRRTLPELSEELFLDIGDASTKRWRFTVLLLLAAVIATTGLLADSTATVIGAMIVAPLGVPIIGVALGIVIADGRRLVASAVTVMLGGPRWWRSGGCWLRSFPRSFRTHATVR
jgi:hypothetical protein